MHCRLTEILSVSLHWFWTKIIHFILNFPWVLFKPIYSSKQQEAQGYFIEFIVSFFVERPVFTGFHCDLTTFLCSLYSFSLSPISGGDYFIVLKKGEPTQWDLQRHSVSKPQIICLPLLSPPLIAGKSFLLPRTSPCIYQELSWIGLIQSYLQKYFSLSFISSHFWLIIFSWLDYFHYTCMINTYHLIEGSQLLHQPPALFSISPVSFIVKLLGSIVYSSISKLPTWIHFPTCLLLASVIITLVTINLLFVSVNFLFFS